MCLPIIELEYNRDDELVKLATLLKEIVPSIATLLEDIIKRIPIGSSVFTTPTGEIIQPHEDIKEADIPDTDEIVKEIKSQETLDINIRKLQKKFFGKILYGLAYRRFYDRVRAAARRIEKEMKGKYVKTGTGYWRFTR